MTTDYLPVDTGDTNLNREINFEIAQRHAENFVDERPWWWLSFCDTEQPEGSQFLGVCIVQAANVIEAAAEAWDLGCNPGGQMASWLIPPDCVPEERWRNRLLTRDEAEGLQR